jgi:predicted membrane protein
MSGTKIRGRQTGSSRLKAIIWTVILASFVYVCIRVVPLYFADYEFQDSLQTVARFASVNHETPEDIRADLFKEAQSAEMPIKLEDIKVDRSNGRVDIQVNYSVTVDLHVYQWTLNFHPSASNSRL